MKKPIFVMILAMVVATILPGSSFGAKPGSRGGSAPFQWQETNVRPDGGGSAALAVFTVPLDASLVIEYASGNVFCATGEAVGFEVWTTVDGVSARHRLPIIALGASGGYATTYLANQSLILNADSGTDVTVYSVCNGTLAVMHAAISGYLVSN